MSQRTVQVTEVDVERARLLRTLAKRLGQPTPASVERIADVAVVHPTGPSAALGGPAPSHG